MPIAPPPLTEKLIRDICQRVRAGCHDHVAAESLGVPQQSLQHWLSRAEEDDAPEIYETLARELMCARAHARMMVEFDMRKNHPQQWLLNGPGRERADCPGWTRPVVAQQDKSTQQISQLELFDFLHLIKKQVVHIPELREALISLLSKAHGLGLREISKDFGN